MSDSYDRIHPDHEHTTPPGIQDGHELRNLSEHSLLSRSVSPEEAPSWGYLDDETPRDYSLHYGDHVDIPRGSSMVNDDGDDVQSRRLPPKAGSTSLRRLTWREKIDCITTVSLIAGTLLALAALSVLFFLWFGHSGNWYWRAVMVGGWLSTAVTICGGVIQQVLNLQLGVAVAMLASLALESRDVLLNDLASVSIIRATAAATSVFTMLWHFFRRLWTARQAERRWTGILLLLLLTLLLWALNQFLLVILVSDVALRPTIGDTTRASVPYSLHYALPGTENVSDSQVYASNVLTSRAIPNRGAWFTKPSAFTAFAEYSEPPFVADGVSDTGRTLRAFLPMRTADLRDNLKYYRGNATVLDARVTCQVPTLDKPSIAVSGLGGGYFQFNGTVAASRETPRLGNRTLQSDSGTADWVFDRPMGFSCRGVITDTDTYWRISICQLYEGGSRAEGGTSKTISGGLVSEFKNLTDFMSVADDAKSGTGVADLDSTTYGTAYLILNSTLGSQYDWEAGLGLSYYYDDDTTTTGYYPVAYQERGEWLDLIYSRSNVILSATLCYAAFDFADMPVEISSNTNRTETSFDPVYDPHTSTYTFAALRQAMGQNRSDTLADRGQLQLASRPDGSWLTTPGENTGPLSTSANDPQSSELYLRSLADLGLASKMDMSDGNIGNISGIMLPGAECPAASSSSSSSYAAAAAAAGDCVVPEAMHAWLLQETLLTGGPVSFALQSAMTLLAGMTYYDQMGQFDKVTPADTTLFRVASVPVSHRGLAIVTAALLVHLATMAVILVLFLRRTSFSRLGACWSALAQVGTGDVAGHLRYATLLSDGQVEEELRRKAVGHEKVRLDFVGEDIVFTHG
ncbi:hypothetical protein VMCG_06646 [Cytospora schulzeri]|uniref:Uncharacterized protein n=1 Tax=Cytospora schulzeri TaxID=448051 RepID=A0A423W6X0_9PEZI|nr:hypothetical protein VMCG_06646 [Valsa malicola]